MPRRLIVLVASAVLAFASSARLAADVDPGYQFYEKAVKEVLKAAGAKVFGAADDARKNGLFQFAYEQAERALEYDPDLEDARKYLGYVKKEGKWALDPDASSRVPKQNTKPQNRSDQAQEQLQKKWEDESLARANKYVAAKYAELGDACAAKGYADQAQKGYEAAMRFDKDNEKARKGLGYTKFGKVWLTKKQDEARKAAAKAEQVKEDETTNFEDLFKTKLTKVQSAHFRFESPYDFNELKTYAEACETAYAYYLADFTHDPGEDVFEGHRALFVVCKTDDQWNALVDAYGGNDKEFTRKLAGMGLSDLGRGVRSDKGSSLESRRDLIVHQAVHMLNRRIWRLGDRAWLDEGLAYYYTLKVLESCLAFCVAQKKGDYANGHQDEGGMKEWGDPDGWKPLLKAWVQKKDDTALRTVVMQPITKLEFRDSVKAWSVTSWLMDLDRDKFMSMLDQLKDPRVKQENVIQGTYSKGLEELDDEWHKYVLKCY